MNEYLKNSNVIVKERIKVNYLEHNSHVAKTVGGYNFWQWWLLKVHNQKYNQWTLTVSREVCHQHLPILQLYDEHSRWFYLSSTRCKFVTLVNFLLSVSMDFIFYWTKWFTLQVIVFCPFFSHSKCYLNITLHNIVKVMFLHFRLIIIFVFTNLHCILLCCWYLT